LGSERNLVGLIKKAMSTRSEKTEGKAQRSRGVDKTTTRKRYRQQINEREVSLDGRGEIKRDFREVIKERRTSARKKKSRVKRSARREKKKPERETAPSA